MHAFDGLAAFVFEVHVHGEIGVADEDDLSAVVVSGLIEHMAKKNDRLTAAAQGDRLWIGLIGDVAGDQWPRGPEAHVRLESSQREVRRFEPSKRLGAGSPGCAPTYKPKSASSGSLACERSYPAVQMKMPPFFT